MAQFGGGFEASQGGYGSQSQLSQSGSKKPPQNLLPVTAAMLRSAEERDLKLFINDRELIVVLLVGNIDSVVVSDRKVDYTVTDCSGIIKVSKWPDEGQVTQAIPEGSYVIVYGKPSIFNGEPWLTAYKMIKCQGYDEVTRHYMSVIYADLYLKKGGTNRITDPQEHAANSARSTVKQVFSSNNDNVTGNENNDANLTQSQLELLRLIKAQENQTENGVNVNWLSEQLNRDTKNDLLYLMNEGQVYDTVDENWVKTT